MERQLHYASEKFGNAVRALVIGRGPIRERLVDACMELGNVRIEEPNGEIEQAIADLKQRVTRVSPQSPGEIGSIHATIRQMQEDEAVEVAEEIYLLEQQLRDMRDEQLREM